MTVSTLHTCANYNKITCAYYIEYLFISPAVVFFYLPCIIFLHTGTSWVRLLSIRGNEGYHFVTFQFLIILILVMAKSPTGLEHFQLSISLWNLCLMFSWNIRVKKGLRLGPFNVFFLFTFEKTLITKAKMTGSRSFG